MYIPCLGFLIKFQRIFTNHPAFNLSLNLGVVNVYNKGLTALLTGRMKTTTQECKSAERKRKINKK